MKKLLFVLLAVATLCACSDVSDLINKMIAKEEAEKTEETEDKEKKENPLDAIYKSIISSESKRLPLTIQEYDGIKRIKIDSLVFINDTEPYSGYLITTWDIYEERGFKSYQLVTKKVNVEVRNITCKDDQVEWYTEWYDAYSYARREQIRN